MIFNQNTKFKIYYLWKNIIVHATVLGSSQPVWFAFWTLPTYTEIYKTLHLYAENHILCKHSLKAWPSGWKGFIANPFATTFWNGLESLWVYQKGYTLHTHMNVSLHRYIYSSFKICRIMNMHIYIRIWCNL